MRLLLFLVFLSSVCTLEAQKPTIPTTLAEPAANAAMAAFPNDRNKRLIFMSSFCEAFLDQWRHIASPQTIARGDQSPYDQGYNAGLRALAGDLKQNDVTPSDFGYLNKTIEGTYNGDIESSEFIEETGERFHTNFGFITRLPAGKVRINVWMSPDTVLGFGHFNQWKREIIICEIENKKS
jgi:hypothetical protein